MHINIYKNVVDELLADKSDDAREGVFKFVTGLAASCEYPEFTALFFKRLSEVIYIPLTVAPTWTYVLDDTFEAWFEECGKDFARLYARMNRSCTYLTSHMPGIIPGHAGIPFYCESVRGILDASVIQSHRDITMTCSTYDSEVIMGEDVVDYNIHTQNEMVATYQRAMFIGMLTYGYKRRITQSEVGPIPDFIGMSDKDIEALNSGNFADISKTGTVIAYGWYKLHGQKLPCDDKWLSYLYEREQRENEVKLDT